MEDCEMPLDKARGLAFVDKIIDVFSDTVGKDFSSVEKEACNISL